ncbi:MAG: hypothetical protein HRT53_17615 [Colwellia sp.]|nr:hypothetical protein [Colwellia sp.]
MWTNPNLVGSKLLTLGFIGSIIGGTTNPMSGFWTLILLCLVGLLMEIKNSMHRT